METFANIYALNYMFKWSCLFMDSLIYVDSFMPIHIGGETDLRFVYCAG